MITKRIACLPVAGIDNPYQHLMIKGLNNSSAINAFNGVDDRFTGIFKTARKYKPDYIHFDWIHSYYERREFWMTLMWLPLFFLQVYYVKRFTKIKLVWTLHNILPHGTRHQGLHKMVRHWFGKQCDWIRVFSETTIEESVKVLNLKKEMFKVVPEGPYIGFYPNNVNKEVARKSLNLGDNDFIFLYLGLIKPYKGIENLITAFEKLGKENSKLIIAGRVMNKEYFSTLNLDHPRIFVYPDFIEENRLQYFFNASDVVVLPFNKVENSGSAILAMGFSKAILAPRMGVLQKRLCNQSNLLYADLEKGIENVFKYNQRDLEKIGQQNFDSLSTTQWQDFTHCF